MKKIYEEPKVNIRNYKTLSNNVVMTSDMTENKEDNDLFDGDNY